ncbi:SAYSvFN domain-containing protein 1 [Hetaerina americana]|uniref:SAYSvFN domain-containing protein 1 n=1 Tax=Hetaerina americana TaxID=62018 RepID=UPI003A7F17C9
MDIEEKLAAYRLRKKREKQMETAKTFLHDIAAINFWKRERQTTSEPISLEDEHLMQPEQLSLTPAEHIPDYSKNERFHHLIRVKNGLYILLWVLLYVIAVELEFGIVYFILSVLLFIWLNTRTGPKAPGEVSAYSVFNPNCEAIDGTLNAEQFESELRYGALNVH